MVEMTEWWNMAEESCHRVGTLRRRLEKERASVLRRMEVLDSDKILSDSQAWWKTALAWIRNPPQSPKTLNARGSCQDQDKNHPSGRKRSSSPIQPRGTEVPLTNPAQTEEELCIGEVDNGDKMSGVSFRIGAVLDGVGCRNLKTLQLVHQPHELPDTNLPAENPPESPKTITARVPCQDQDKNLPTNRKRSSSAIQPSGRGVPLPSIHQEEHHAQNTQWSTNLIGLVGWWRRVEKEGEKEGIDKDKEKKKEDERKRKITAKINFLSKFYPDTHSSPGGNIRIVKNRNLVISDTDGNSDKGTGETEMENLALETCPRILNKQLLILSKRKSENIHTGEAGSSPSKRLKFSTFSKKLQFWCNKDTPGSGNMTEPNGKLRHKMEEQGSGGKQGGESEEYQV